MLRIVIRKKNKNGVYIKYVRKVNKWGREGIYYYDGKLYLYDGYNIIKEFESYDEVDIELDKMIRVKKIESIIKKIENMI